jgi:Flp pilus assembly protein TadD
VLSLSPQEEAARKGESTAATQLALSARRDGHPEIALEVLRHACEKEPDDPQLLLDRGIQATDLEQLPEAEQSLHAARALAPKNLTILYALARVEIEEQHMPDAERDLKAYLAVKPSDASAHYGLGHIYAMQQRTAEARAEFETSLKLQPKQTESYYQLGELDLEAHQDAQAAPLFQRVLAAAPNHAGALTGMGELSFRAKQYATAEHYLAEAEKADPGYPLPHYYRGLALARLGRTEEAQAELRKGDSRPHATVPPPYSEAPQPVQPDGLAPASTQTPQP